MSNEIERTEDAIVKMLIKGKLNDLYNHEDENDKILDKLESDLFGVLENFMDALEIEPEDPAYLNEHVWELRDAIVSNFKEDVEIFKLK